jgi:hypothetical protein
MTAIPCARCGNIAPKAVWLDNDQRARCRACTIIEAAEARVADGAVPGFEASEADREALASALDDHPGFLLRQDIESFWSSMWSAWRRGNCATTVREYLGGVVAAELFVYRGGLEQAANSVQCMAEEHGIKFHGDIAAELRAICTRDIRCADCGLSMFHPRDEDDWYAWVNAEHRCDNCQIDAAQEDRYENYV